MLRPRDEEETSFLGLVPKFNIINVSFHKTHKKERNEVLRWKGGVEEEKEFWLTRGIVLNN